MRPSSTPTASRSDQCQDRSGGCCEPRQVHPSDRVDVSDLCHRPANHRRPATDDARPLAVSRPARSWPHAVCLHAVQLVMSAVCKTCGAVWAGASLGRLWHCRTGQVRAKKPAVVVEIAPAQEPRRMCECGQVATTTSAVTSRPDPVCQRCYDCEKKNQRNFGKGSDSITEGYKVRMPRAKNLF